ncbi:hypothetical protein YC2023_065044 [Brassica napus]
MLPEAPQNKAQLRLELAGYFKILMDPGEAARSLKQESRDAKGEAEILYFSKYMTHRSDSTILSEKNGFVEIIQFLLLEIDCYVIYVSLMHK